MKLTPFAKVFIAAVVLLTVGGILAVKYDLVGMRRGATAQRGTNLPARISLAQEYPAQVGGGAGCADKPEVRFYLWAWNSQMGLMEATGGRQAAAQSRMCKAGVNLRLIREDSVDQMQNFLATFAEELAEGTAHPKKGAHFVAIMGDGSAAFLKAVNDRLEKIHAGYRATVVGSAGFSRGEDKFMGPPGWKSNPQSARGALVAGVLRDGDWNIAVKWAADNGIPNNPDEKSYDPNAINWVAASDYLDAAEKYVAGYCESRKNTVTGSSEKRCVDGVVTWTPGDVNVAKKKGGLVSIVSTAEYRSQMPNAIIGIAPWMQANRPLVLGMLDAIFAGGEEVKTSDAAKRRAASISALVYNEQDADYWYRYSTIQRVRDAKGIEVELGGSAVNNLDDNLALFGLQPGSANAFATTYTVFGQLVVSQYPDLVPSIYPATEALDTSFLRELAARPRQKTHADAPEFLGGDLRSTVSQRSWRIHFNSGSAVFAPDAKPDLDKLYNDLVVASGLAVRIEGHTDAQGSDAVNQQLSEDRAMAVKNYLEGRSPGSFPRGRIRVVAHGSRQPIAPNKTAEGRAQNRRVDIVMGTQ